MRKIIEINEEQCNGCGQCVPACAEGALQIVDGKVRLVSEVYCDGLGACLGECPQDAIRIIEREAAEFDPEAVERYLEGKGKEESAPEKNIPHACPSSKIQMFTTPCDTANRPAYQSVSASALSHWPVQIALVPPTAPFLRGARLLVAADCTPLAYPNFHDDFLKDRVVMIGCPKFDNVQEYVGKFAEIFQVADIQNVTVIDMEVPCCSRLPLIVKKGMELAHKVLPFEEIVISTRGEVLKHVSSTI
ncbi:MAG: ATP-binding protein [Dissulfurispiraceae bacterium]